MSFSEWLYVNATDFCGKVTDGTHDSPKRKETGKPLITSKHIKGTTIDFDSAYFISEEDFNKINLRSKVDQWDVLISMIGEYCGYSFVEKNPIIDYAVKNVGIFKAGSELKAKWIYYYLNSIEGRQTLSSLRSGTSQPYLSLGALRTLPVLVSKNEKIMERIVSILSSLDDKIELNRQTNQTLEAIAQTLFQEMCVPKGDELPEGWRVGKLGDLGEFKNGINYSRDDEGDSEFFIVNVRNVVESKFLLKSNLSTIKIDYKKAKPYLLEVDDIVIVRSASPGETAILFFPEHNIIYSGFTIRFRLKDKSHFLYYFFIFQSLKKQLDNLSNGTTLKNVNQEILKSYEIIIPEQNVIEDFNKSVEPIYKMVLSNLQENQTLTTLRDSLLPKLMKGEIEI